MTSQDYSAIFAGASAVIALGALVATVVLGRMNLRQTRRGPDKTPAWSLSRGSGDTVLLKNGAEAGPAYDVNIEPPNTPAFRADLHHERVEPGSSISMMLRFTGGTSTAERRLAISYRVRPDGPVEQWSSSVPS